MEIFLGTFCPGVLDISLVAYLYSQLTITVASKAIVTFLSSHSTLLDDCKLVCRRGNDIHFKRLLHV